MNHLTDLAITIDKWVNDKWLGGKWQTISARVGYRVGKEAWAGPFCRFLGWLFRNPNHCKDAMKNDNGN